MQILLEDEGAMSPQTDESITSMCLEAMNQDDEDFVPPTLSSAAAAAAAAAPDGGGGAGEEGGDSDDADGLFDEAEFSDLIHLATDMPMDVAVDDTDLISDMIRMTSDMSVDEDGAGVAALGNEQRHQAAIEGPKETQSMAIGAGGDDPMAAAGESSPGLEPTWAELKDWSPGDLGSSLNKPDAAWQF